MYVCKCMRIDTYTVIFFKIIIKILLTMSCIRNSYNITAQIPEEKKNKRTFDIKQLTIN